MEIKMKISDKVALALIPVVSAGIGGLFYWLVG